MSKAPQNAVRPFGWQDKLGYSMGDMGCNWDGGSKNESQRKNRTYSKRYN